MEDESSYRSPGYKLGIALLIGVLLAIPLFTVYLLVYDRQSQSETARASIAKGWGGAQALAGPVLVIPYRETATETVIEGGKPVTKTKEVWKELTLAPNVAEIDSTLKPDVRRRSIYEAVVYESRTSGKARFALPVDLARIGVTADRLAYDRAELRFGLLDARGLTGARPTVLVTGQPHVLQPGKGPQATNGSGFFAWVDAAPLRAGPMVVDYRFDFRGNGWLTMVPQAGDTRWTVRSAWPHPSFQGGFLPEKSQVGPNGFVAVYRIGNLALGRSLLSADEARPEFASDTDEVVSTRFTDAGGRDARVTLIQPIDLYSQVNRSVKYGFLFIGFTFITFLLFDVVGGVRVSAVEYLMVGAGLVLFFVMLLAFAEVIGFDLAYLVASGSIVALLASYSWAVLGALRRAGLVLGLLAALYTVLYVLLSLEELSLLIGSVMLFVALALVMFLTRHIDWGRRAPRASHAA